MQVNPIQPNPVQSNQKCNDINEDVQPELNGCRGGWGSMMERAGMFSKKGNFQASTPCLLAHPFIPHAQMHYRADLSNGWHRLCPLYPHSPPFFPHFTLLTAQAGIFPNMCFISWVGFGSGHALLLLEADTAVGSSLAVVCSCSYKGDQLIRHNWAGGDLQVISWSSTSDCLLMAGWWGPCLVTRAMAGWPGGWRHTRHWFFPTWSPLLCSSYHEEF